MHCHGKCHLKKEMQKDDDQQNSPEQKQESIVFYHTSVSQNQFFTQELLFMVSDLSQKILTGVNDPVFRPPGFVS